PPFQGAAGDERVRGSKQIFLQGLVGGPPSKPPTDGDPISPGRTDATRPDITFSANTPYVSWRSKVNGVTTGFVGHFINPSDPTFVLDESSIPLTPTAQADVREPISSNSTANPFNLDGVGCQGTPPPRPTPVFLFTPRT